MFITCYQCVDQDDVTENNHLPDDLEDARAPQCQCQLCSHQIHSQYVYYILHLIFEMEGGEEGGGRRPRSGRTGGTLVEATGIDPDLGTSHLARV